jgi:hypothetical protein
LELQDQIIETIGHGGAIEEQLVAYVELVWWQKVKKMSHFADMSNYEASAIDPQLVCLTKDIIERTKVH